MGLFKNLLKSDESLFRDTIPLDFDYMPKLVPFRTAQQRQFALAIKPLLQEHTGRNLFVYGAPGVGKTVACKHVLKELEEEIVEEFVEEIIPPHSLPEPLTSVKIGDYVKAL